MNEKENKPEIQLPDFDIPEFCQRPSEFMTLEDYHEWVSANNRELRKRGLYRPLREKSLEYLADVRFRLEP